MAVGTVAESPIETPVATREVGRSRVVVQLAEIRDGVLPSVVGNHGPRGVELVVQVVQPDEKARPDRGLYVLATKALVGGHPGADRRSISIGADHACPLRRQPSLGSGGPCR